jgi:acyl-CoA reductase-like NAD-dependent aldehyde dehydrogenase
MVQGVLIKDGSIQNTNPATGELIEPSVAVTTPEELADAIQKANDAQTVWGDCLYAIASLCSARLWPIWNSSRMSYARQ